MVAPMVKDRLSASDWVKVAFRALTKGGLGAVRVEPIARDLGVSKGSFYWHFKDLPHLKAAMQETWRIAANEAVIALVEQAAEEPRERLRHLIAQVTGDIADEYGGAGVEAALREWARYDTEVGQLIGEMDRRRLDFVTSLFLAAGLPEADAEQSARQLYAALIGLEQLSPAQNRQREADLLALLELLLSRQPAR